MIISKLSEYGLIIWGTPQKRMQKIGLDKNFDDFIIFTKNIFKRRSSLMRELQENQL